MVLLHRQHCRGHCRQSLLALIDPMLQPLKLGDSRYGPCQSLLLRHQLLSFLMSQVGVAGTDNHTMVPLE